MDRFKLFGERQLLEVCNERRTQMQREVLGENEDYLLNANEGDLIEHYVSKCQFMPITLHWDQITVSEREAMIPAERFPGDFNVTHGRSYKKQVITYHVPFSGDQVLLRLECGGGGYRVEAALEKDSINLDVVNFYDKVENIKVRSDQLFKRAKELCQDLLTGVEEFNRTIRRDVQVAVQKRKEECLKRKNMIEALGVPIKRADNVPDTFSVPISKKKIIVERPNAPSTPFAPEHVLAESVYVEILKVVHEMGVEMERHPSIYQDKGEEALRDHFIMFLSPHFQSTTGETFNKQGKTDILIRHEKNVFVAECKFWGGAKLFHDTINQLFGYLTWRDSKAAIVLFVDTKELSGVLDTIAVETPKHPCFVRDQGKRSDGWFAYDFHLPGDTNRHVKVAIVVFHFPQIRRPSKPKKR